VAAAGVDFFGGDDVFYLVEYVSHL
jgi:hypothetical protein